MDEEGGKVRREGGGRKKSEDEKGMRTKKRGRWKVDRGVEVEAGGVEGSGGKCVNPRTRDGQRSVAVIGPLWPE